MIVFLDIGATLVEGPDRGPAGRIRDKLGLDRAAGRALNKALMTHAWTDPAAVAAWVADNFALPFAAAIEAVSEIWSAQLVEAQPVHGAPEAVRRLREAGLRIGLVSNIWHPYLESARRHYREQFKAMSGTAPQLFSYVEGVAKPDATLYRRAIERTGCRPEDCVMIGDTYVADIEPALAAGMRTIWVLHRPDQERADLVHVLDGRAPKPTRTVESIADVTPGMIAALAASPGATALSINARR